MRIAHVTATFPPYAGGTGNVCYHNAIELAKLGHEVHVFTATVAGAPSAEVMDGVTVHRLHPLVRVGNAPLLPGLIFALRGFDLIHLHYPFIGGAEMVRTASLLYRIPLVISFHNDLIGEGGRAKFFAAYQKISALLTVRWADLLCSVSADHYRHSTLRRSLRSTQPPSVELPNGVDMDVFRPTNANEVLRLRNMHGIAEDALLVLFVAALDRAHHFKGLDRLLDAFAHLHGESVSAARLLVVGDGDLRSQYEARARELGLSKRAIFVGSLAHEATAAYFAAADVTVLPSSPPESFGLVLIESMACATPVIASDIPGVRTVVQDQIDGLLVEQANIDALTDALDTMLSLPQADHNTMGAKGMSKVRCRYTWSRIGMQLQNIYCDLLETNRSMGSRYMETAIRRPKQRA